MMMVVIYKSNQLVACILRDFLCVLCALCGEI